LALPFSPRRTALRGRLRPRRQPFLRL